MSTVAFCSETVLTELRNSAKRMKGIIIESIRAVMFDRLQLVHGQIERSDFKCESNRIDWNRIVNHNALQTTVTIQTSLSLQELVVDVAVVSCHEFPPRRSVLSTPLRCR